MTTRVLTAMLLISALGAMGSPRPLRDHFAVATALAQQPEPVDEFVPIDQLPPQDQLPAAPLLVSAYAFAVLVLFAYIVSVARRLGGVQRDLERLQSDLKRNGHR